MTFKIGDRVRNRSGEALGTYKGISGNNALVEYESGTFPVPLTKLVHADNTANKINGMGLGDRVRNRVTMLPGTIRAIDYSMGEHEFEVHYDNGSRQTDAPFCFEPLPDNDISYTHQSTINPYVITFHGEVKNMSLTPDATLKYLRWVRDGGDHTHVNAPTAAEIYVLEGYMDSNPPLLEYQEYQKQVEGELNERYVWAPKLTTLGTYELARLETRA